MNSSFPRAFGSYTLLGAWASGGMGEVYLARLGDLDGASRLCLVKTLRGDIAREAGYAERFVDEAKIVMQLQHSGVCQVFDAGRVDGTPYLAMELVRGVDLRRFIDALAAQGRGVPEGCALWLGCEILEALDAAHRQIDAVTGKPLNIVHRDVSPHNVLLSFNGEVKLIDFGLAQSSIKESHTESNVVLGKIAYMAPEHARGEPTDHTVDQFAVAVLIYELVAGDRYYGDMTSYEIWQLVGRGDHIPRKWASIDSELAGALTPAMAMQKEDRYESCGELAARLRGLLAVRHPMMGRAVVASMMQQLFKEAVEEQSSRISIMSTTPKASKGPVYEQATGATQTVHVGRRHRSRAAWLALGAVALAAAAVVIAFRLAPRTGEDERLVVVPVPVAAASAAPAVVVVSAAPSVAQSAEPVLADDDSDDKPAVRPKPKKKSYAETLPRARKLELLKNRKELCAVGVMKMANPPNALIDECVDKIF